MLLGMPGRLRRRNGDAVNIGLRVELGQAVAECYVEDVAYAPDMIDDLLKRLGQAVGNALMTAQALDIPTIAVSLEEE